MTTPAGAFQDRVVRVAFSEGLLSRDEINNAWTEFRKTGRPRGARLWRFMADRQRNSREALFELAARVYGFEEVGISVSDVIAFVRNVSRRFTAAEWEQMSQLRILPIGIEDHDTPELGRLVFACSDPTRLEVNNFLSKLSPTSFVLLYASSTSVDYVIDRVLPVLFSGDRRMEGRIFKPAVRLVPLDPLREIMEERGGYRRAA